MLAGSKVRSSPAKAGRADAASEAAMKQHWQRQQRKKRKRRRQPNFDAFATTIDERCCGWLATALGLKAEAREREACISRVGGCFGGGEG